MSVVVEPEIAQRVAQAEPSLISNARSRWLLGGILFLTTLCMLHRIRRGEFNLNVDEEFHACTGQYFADLLRDHPIRHPLEYTYVYYAHYPAIAVVHWPPLFYVVEGIAFLLLGYSVVVARLATLAFALLGVVYWFRLVEGLEDKVTAAGCALVLPFLPFVLLYEKAVMLEIPSLALSIAATFYWLEYLQKERKRYLYSFAVLAALALLTKENCVYLAPFCLLTIVAEKRWRLFAQRPLWYALGIVLGLVGPFYAVMGAVHAHEVLSAVAKGSSPIPHPWAFYLEALPRQLGWPLLILASIGMIASPWWRKRQNVVPMFLWIGSCYVTFNLFAEKDARYIIYWIPPLIYFAVSPLTTERLPSWLRRPALALLVLIIASFAWQAWRFQRPYVAGYEAAARRLMAAKEPGMVLFDGILAGNFIFFVRKFDPGVKCYVMRKALYETMGAYSSRQLANTPADIEATLRSYGVEYIVVEQNTRMDFPIQHTLRQLLETPQFEVLGVFPIESNMAQFGGAKLVIYRNRAAAPPLRNRYRIRMMALDHDIVVPLVRGGSR